MMSTTRIVAPISWKWTFPGRNAMNFSLGFTVGKDNKSCPRLILPRANCFRRSSAEFVFPRRAGSFVPANYPQAAAVRECCERSLSTL